MTTLSHLANLLRTSLAPAKPTGRVLPLRPNRMLRSIRYASAESSAPDRRRYPDGRAARTSHRLPDRFYASSASSETTINTHRSGVVQRFSPIHF